MSDFIEIKIESKEVERKLQELAKKSSDLKPLMKNIAGIFASAAEDNFAEEGRSGKWQNLSKITKKLREKKGKWPGQILQVSGQLASSVNTYYDNDSAVIGSNLEYAAIHQLGGQAGRNKKVTIPARPYIQLFNDNFDEILNLIERHVDFMKSKNKFQ